MENETKYPNTAEGQLLKAKHALINLEQIIGQKPWLTMAITIVDFQQYTLSKKDAIYKPIDKAVRAFVRAQGR